MERNSFFYGSEEIEKLQERELKELIEYVYENSSFYRELFIKNRIVPSDIEKLEDLKKIPFTTKDDLRKHNWDFLCTPKEEIVEIVSSSGTTGTPTFIAMTERDVRRLTYNEFKGFSMAGFTKKDIVQLLVTLDNMFIAGNAFYKGVQRIGSTVYRAGPGNKERHIMLIKNLKPTAIVGIASFALTLANFSKSKGTDLRKSSLKKGMFVGETIIDKDLGLNELGKRVKEALNIDPFSTYGNTEMACSLSECTEHQGLHNKPDLLIIEIVDEKGKNLPSGEIGELVITTLGTQGMPLVRYRTGDLTYIIEGTCKCGRNTKRIGPIFSRKHHLLKVKGTNVYPGHIENAIMEIKGIENYVVEAYTEKNLSDGVRVKIGVKNTKNKILINKVKEKIKAHARVTPKISLMKPDEILKIQLSKNNRKPQKFIDRRKE